jgi:hypothetical protein
MIAPLLGILPLPRLHKGLIVRIIGLTGADRADILSTR